MDNETERTNVVKGLNPLHYHLRRLNTKIAKGEYVFEKASCFCGSDRFLPFTSKDRYDLPYVMGLCQNCGILYANPRMTEDSQIKFYKEDYRIIYDNDYNIDDEHDRQIEKGNEIKNLCNEHDINPKTVFEIGCNTGGILEAFKGKNAIGIDFNKDNIKYGQDKGLFIVVGGIEKIEALGFKADLIILNHVIEHFNNIEAYLDRISNLLNPNGCLYISVPSLYSWRWDELFQSAHNWQFTAETLGYAMKCCGYEELYCDEGISSLWMYSGIKGNKLANPKAVKEISDFLNNKKNIPVIKTFNKFPLKQRKENIGYAMSLKLPDLSNILNIEAGQKGIIIGGAPSVEKYIDKIKALKEAGQKVISIERMYSFCLDNDIIPDYVVCVDACNDVIEGFENVNKDTVHIISAQCGKDVFDRLKDNKIYLFNAYSLGMRQVVNYWNDNNYEKITIVNAGGSVTLTAMSIAMTLGIKDIHIFGFDCHITDGLYAKGIKGVGHQDDIIEVIVDGKLFKTTPAYLSFAQQFFDLYRLGKINNILNNIKVYGNSIVKHMAKIDIEGDKECQNLFLLQK